MRPTLEETYLRMAQVASRRSGCTRSENSQVGAVLVTPMNIAITSWNGTERAGQPECFEGGCPRGKLSLSECPSGERLELCTYVHAEGNAVKSALKSLKPVDILGSTMYVTREPCAECTKLLHSYNISAVWPTGRFDL